MAQFTIAHVGELAVEVYEFLVDSAVDLFELGIDSGLDFVELCGDVGVGGTAQLFCDLMEDVYASFSAAVFDFFLGVVVVGWVFEGRFEQFSEGDGSGVCAHSFDVVPDSAEGVPAAFFLFLIFGGGVLDWGVLVGVLIVPGGLWGRLGLGEFGGISGIRHRKFRYMSVWAHQIRSKRAVQAASW